MLVGEVTYGDRFVARFEPGVDKKTSSLLISGWWWEKEVKPDTSMKKSLKDCFTGFLKYLGLNNIRVISNADDRNKIKWLETL